MDIVAKSHRIAGLIVKNRMDALNDAEKRELEDWLVREKNRDLFDQLKKEVDLDLQVYRMLDTEKSWIRYKKKYLVRKIPLKKWMSIAASILLVVTSIAIWQVDPFQHEEVASAEIYPGGSKATLILDDGSSVELGHNQFQYIEEKDKTKISTSEDQVCYNEKDVLPGKENQAELYNTLVVPVGGEYKLLLADGTVVWINSQTKIKYPVHFNTDKRHVWLDGEAFFEVAENKEKPFIVHVDDEVQVKVLGTSFNVKAYNDEENIQTVLVEGQVEVSCQSSNDDAGITLEPGNMASFSRVEKSFDVHSVNTELHTAWINGQFYFKNHRLEDVMRSLSRWYNFTIEYEDEHLMDLRFTLNVKRYNNIQVLLDALEMVEEIKFNINEDKIYVEKSN